MKRIRIDTYNLPKVDGFKHLILCVDFFSKWLKAKATKSKTAPAFASVQYYIIYRQECIKIQINEQCKEFVNQLYEGLHEMIKGQNIGLVQHTPTVNCITYAF